MSRIAKDGLTIPDACEENHLVEPLETAQNELMTSSQMDCSKCRAATEDNDWMHGFKFRLGQNDTICNSCIRRKEQKAQNVPHIPQTKQAIKKRK